MDPNPMSDVSDLQNTIASLERSLERERKARKDAEQVLRAKAQELSQSNKTIISISERLQQALKASHQYVWEWDPTASYFVLFDNVEQSSEKIIRKGSFDDFSRAIQKSYRGIFVQAWDEMIHGKSQKINIKLKYHSQSSGQLKWMKLTGRSVRDPSAKLLRIVGTLQDITVEMQQRNTFEVVTSAFMHASNPCFIIDFLGDHIEANKSLCGLLDLEYLTNQSATLFNVLPIEQIKIQQKKGERTFVASMEVNNERRDYKFLLTDMPSQEDVFHYCVGNCWLIE